MSKSRAISTKDRNQLSHILADLSFSLLDQDINSSILDNSDIVIYDPGERICRPDEKSNYIHVILTGRCRVLASTDSLSITLLGPKTIIGWIGLLRNTPTEYIHKYVIEALRIPNSVFLNAYLECSDFKNFFDNQSNVSGPTKVHVYLSGWFCAHRCDRANSLKDFSNILTEFTAVRV